MSRAALGWLGTLLLLLCGAYFAWTHEAKSGGDNTPVVVLDIEADQIDRVSFSNEKREVVLEAKTDAGGRYTLLTLSETVKKKVDDTVKAGDETARDDEKEAPPEKKVRRFAGGRAARRLLDRLAPLTALRLLDDVSPDRLEKLGLEPAEATFSITRGERTFTFAVGGKAFGGSRRYLHEKGSKKVYLVEATALRNLEGAERQLLERSVLGARREELASVTATAGTKRQVLIQQNRADRRAAYWAFESKPEEKAAIAGNWVDKLFRLRVDTYLDAIPEGAETVCTFVAKTDDAEITVSLHRAMDENGEAEVYASSSSLRLPVKVYRQSGLEVIDDIASLFTE